MKRYDRRTFLKLSGASAVMLALAACDDSCSSGSTSSGSATETPPSPPIPVIRDGQKILTIFNAELARRKVENIKFEYSKGLEHAIQADVQMFVDNGSPELKGAYYEIPTLCGPCAGCGLLLAGCGGTQSSPSAAADQSSDSSRSTPGAVAQAAQQTASPTNTRWKRMFRACGGERGAIHFRPCAAAGMRQPGRRLHQR